MAEDIRMRLTENATGVSKCYVDAKVSVEAETRETADSVLDGRISGLKSDIEAEVDQRTAADAELEKKANRNATDIQTEHNRAVGMESVLGDAVKTEQRRAEAAEGLIKGLVTQAEEARKSGDDTLGKAPNQRAVANHGRLPRHAGMPTEAARTSYRTS